MTEEQALAAEEEILATCRKYGLWVTSEHSRKPTSPDNPGLKFIRLEISIKVVEGRAGKNA